ncbi:MAG: hypothetical protein HYX27_07015 [Acidobacteria bacterium]|nr:hypothetical protein [Acidobacteriota bacterium]
MIPLLFAFLATPDPCSYLPEQEVRQVFEIHEMTPIRVVRADSCSYLWMGLPPTGQQLREALMAGRHVPPRANESLSIRIEPVAHAIKELDARFEKLLKGYSVDRDGQELKVKPQNLQWVPNVGEKAFWNDSLNQLVVARKNELVSFVVKKPGKPQADVMNLAITAAQAAMRKP